MTGKVRVTDHESGRYVGFMCPGCGSYHGVRVGEGGPLWQSGPVWQWNGSVDAPTLTPSLLVRYDFDGGASTARCHVVLTDGVAHVQGDSTHGRAGQSLPLAETDWSNWAD